MLKKLPSLLILSILFVLIFSFGCKNGNSLGSESSWQGLPTASVPTGETILTGTITQPDGIPVGNASISILKQQVPITSAVTNVQGQYSVIVDAGTYTIRIQRSGFVTSEQNILVKSGIINVYNAVISSSIGSLKGYTASRSTGERISGTEVQITSITNPALSISAAITDAAGNYEFILATGEYSLSAVKSEYITETVKLTVNSGSEVIQNFLMYKSAGKIFGLITNLAGEPVKDASVRATDLSGKTVQAVSGDDGKYTVSVNNGTNTVSVSKSGFGTVVSSIYLSPESEVLLDVQLGPVINLIGTVKSFDTKEVLPNIEVSALLSGISVAGSPSRTTAEGKFIFQNISPGLYEITLRSLNGGYEPATYVIQIMQNGTISPASPELFMNVSKNLGKILGQITDRAGNAQKDVLIRLMPLSADLLSYEATTTDDGKYSFSIPAGNYIFSASKASFMISSATVQIVMSTTKLYDIALGPQSTLTGKIILDTNSSAIANLQIKLFLAAALVDTANTSPSGEFVFQNLAPGNYTVSVTDPALAHSPATFTVQVLNDGSVAPKDPVFSIKKIVGKVLGMVSSQNGTPQANATVRFESTTAKTFEATTSSDGKYSILLNAGNYAVTVMKSGFRNFSGNIVVTEGNDLTSDFQLEQSVNLTGTVQLDSTKAPLVNINASAYLSGVVIAGSPVKTNSEGKFVFQNLTSGAYQIGLVSTSGEYEAATFSVQILNDGTISPANPQLLMSVSSTLGKVFGIVSNRSGAPQSNATIRFTSSANKVTESISGTNGTYSVLLEAGNYAVKVIKSGFAEHSENITVTADNDLSKDFQLGPLVNVIGTVKLDTDSSTLPNITVRAYLNSVEVSGSPTKTTSEGKFAFGNLSPGLYELRLTDSLVKYEPATYSLQILNDGTLIPTAPELKMQVSKNSGRISGIISDRVGTLQEEALVRLLPQIVNGTSYEFSTEENGKYYFSVVPGSYTLLVTKAGFVNSSQTVSITIGDEKLLDILLGPISTMKGTVKLNSNSEVLPNIRVEAYLNKVLMGETVTNPAGEFVFQQLSPGTYEIGLARGSTSYDPATYSIQVLNDGSIMPSSPVLLLSSKVLTAEDIRHALATGSVYDSFTGADLQYVQCSLKGYGGTISDDQGKFSFTNLVPGTYELTFKKPGWQDLTVNFTVMASGTVTSLIPASLVYEMVQKQETNVGAITGRYVDEITGNGVDDLIVRVYVMKYVQKTITVVSIGANVEKDVSYWEVSTLPFLSTRTGQAPSAVVSASGTFRLEHLKPTSDDEKYLVYIGNANSAMTTTTFSDPADIGAPVKTWTVENIANVNRVHSWSLVTVSANTTTYLENYNLPNF
ncbi:MAG: carboxypeptidase regulatory-like domain-containing protein [Candidatus Riflebacteria bacterium]|nr:carboxypeptidase regulatory-like domain-containing protein [Candidatus Riflebacteria bacterium]